MLFEAFTASKLLLEFDVTLKFIHEVLVTWKQESLLEANCQRRWGYKMISFYSIKIIWLQLWNFTCARTSVLIVSQDPNWSGVLGLRAKIDQLRGKIRQTLKDLPIRRELLSNFSFMDLQINSKGYAVQCKTRKTQPLKHGLTLRQELSQVQM